MHHTKDKGDIGEAAVTLDLMEKGYVVCVPLSDARYDLIATKGSNVYRIQVKYRTIKKGTMEFKNRNTWGNVKKGSVSGKLYSCDEIDYFAVTNGKVFAYVPVGVMKTGTFTVRVEPPRNNQYSKCNFIESFNDLLPV